MTKFDGADGKTAGVDTENTLDNAPGPKLVTAETRNLYATARVNPVTANDSELEAVCGIAVHVVPPLLDTSTL
jgi:hypothetical protein